MKKLAIVGATCLLALLITGIWVFPMMADRFLYPPSPEPLTELPGESMSTLLARLESVLRLKAPKTYEGLRPGLSEQEVDAIESKFNVSLPDDLKSFYMWRNGSAGETGGFIPAHRFLPLGEALQYPSLLAKQKSRMSIPERLSYRLFAGYREQWIPILKDPADDGYFYDPERRPSSGCFLFHFAEFGYYIYFPSWKNVVAGVINCYEDGVYHEAANGLESDLRLESALWLKYGVANQN